MPAKEREGQMSNWGENFKPTDNHKEAPEIRWMKNNNILPPLYVKTYVNNQKHKNAVDSTELYSNCCSSVLLFLKNKTSLAIL